VDRTLRLDESHVAVTLQNGQERRLDVQHALGSLDHPLDEDQLDAKVQDLLRDYRDPSSAQLRREVQALEKASDVRPMARQLLRAR
jgi:hypothetical protein